MTLINIENNLSICKPIKTRSYWIEIIWKIKLKLQKEWKNATSGSFLKRLVEGAFMNMHNKFCVGNYTMIRCFDLYITIPQTISKVYKDMKNLPFEVITSCDNWQKEVYEILSAFKNYVGILSNQTDFNIVQKVVLAEDWLIGWLFGYLR